MKKTALYLHIPYCKSRCKYCDFHSQGGASLVPDEYVAALICTLKSYKLPPFDTVYFGGGTPSLLSQKQVLEILQSINRSKTAEITLELNPKTATLEKLKAYNKLGINRLSIGVQSLSDAALQLAGRGHTAKDALKTIATAKSAGFENISVDVMLGLPSDSPLDTISQLLGQNIQHISLYMLKIEKNTDFYINTPKNLLTDDQMSDLYTAATTLLQQNGFTRYEISNFANSGYESRHNLIYWNCQDYLGIGAAAHSCLLNKRFYYENDTEAFINGAKTVQDGICNANDFIMLSLRLEKGCSLSLLNQRYNYTFNKKQLDFISKLARQKLATFDGSALKLTTKGMLLQNSILVQLL